MLLKYNTNLKENATSLRNNLTDSEKKLWANIRRKQIIGIQFYRQRRVGPHIVDFYAPSIDLVIEIDGGQHFTEEHLVKDNIRDNYLCILGLTVLRFDNLQVLQHTGAVLGEIYKACENRLLKNS